MEDVLGLVLSKDFLHTVFLADGGDDGLHTEVFMVVGHIETHIVHWCFCLIDKNKFRWLELGYLTRHFGTDGTGCTCNEDALATEHIADGSKIDLNLFARKEVFNFNLAELMMAEI